MSAAHWRSLHRRRPSLPHPRPSVVASAVEDPAWPRLGQEGGRKPRACRGCTAGDRYPWGGVRWSRGREEGPGREATLCPDYLSFRLFLGAISPAQFPLLCPSPFASGQSCPSVVFCAKYRFCEAGRGLSSISEPLLKSFKIHVTKCPNMNLDQV